MRIEAVAEPWRLLGMCFKSLCNRRFCYRKRIAKQLGGQFENLPYFESLRTRAVQDFSCRPSGDGAGQNDLREVADVDGLAEKMPTTRQTKRIATAQPGGHSLVMEMFRKEVQSSAISQDDGGSKDGPALGDILMQQQFFATSFFGEFRMVFEENGVVVGLGEGSVLRGIHLVSGKNHQVSLRCAAEKTEVLPNVFWGAGEEIDHEVKGLAGLGLFERPFLYRAGQFARLLTIGT